MVGAAIANIGIFGKKALNQMDGVGKVLTEVTQMGKIQVLLGKQTHPIDHQKKKF